MGQRGLAEDGFVDPSCHTLNTVCPFAFSCIQRRILKGGRRWLRMRWTGGEREVPRDRTPLGLTRNKKINLGSERERERERDGNEDTSTPPLPPTDTRARAFMEMEI